MASLICFKAWHRRKPVQQSGTISLFHGQFFLSKVKITNQ